MYSRRVQAANTSLLSDAAHTRADDDRPTLAPFYYLKNFELVLATILGALR